MLDGMGSSGRVVGGLPVRILETSPSVRGMKEGNDEPRTVLPLGGERQLVELFPDGCHFLCEKGSTGISSEVGSWGRRRRVEQSFEGGEWFPSVSCTVDLVIEKSLLSSSDAGWKGGQKVLEA